VRARILRIEEDDKKVGLSMRGVTQPDEEEIAELNAAAAAKKAADYRPGREAAKESGVVKVAVEDEVEEPARRKKASADSADSDTDDATDEADTEAGDQAAVHSPEEA
jgi:predicted RNA-binding protein with RPS1 domain